MKNTLKKLKNYVLIGATSIAAIFGAGTLTGCGKSSQANEASIQEEQEALRSKMEELEASYKELKEENAELRKKIDNESISIQEENRENQTFETKPSYVILGQTITEKETEPVIEKKELTFDEIINTVQFDSVEGTSWTEYYDLSFYLGDSKMESIHVASVEEYLEDCTKLSCLTSLELNQIDLSNPDNLEKVILCLKLNSQLEEVSFDWCQMNDAMMNALASLLPKNIAKISASYNGLTNLEFLKYGFPNLIHLRVECNDLTDINGLNYLENSTALKIAYLGKNLIVDPSPLKRFENLMQIGLEHNEIEEPALLPTQSEVLNIYNNNWNEEDIEALEEICTPDKIAGERHYWPGYWQEYFNLNQEYTRSLNK